MDALVEGEEEELLTAVGHLCRADAGPAHRARHSQAPVPPARRWHRLAARRALESAELARCPGQ